MKQSLILYVVLLLSALLSPVSAQEEDLSYHLAEGESYCLELTLQQNTFSEGQEGARVSLSTYTSLAFRVDSAGERSYRMKVSYRDLQLSMLSTRLEIDISSERDRNGSLAYMISQVENREFDMWMKKNGEVVRIEGLNELLDSTRSPKGRTTEEETVVRETLREAFGLESLKGHCALFLGFYPTFPQMHKWTSDLVYHFNTRPVQVSNSLQLAKVNESDYIIQGLGMLLSSEAFKETGEMGQVESVVAGSQTYDFTVDRENGWPLKGLSRQRMRIETTVINSDYLPRGLKIPSYTESLYEIEGGKAGTFENKGTCSEN